MYNQLEVPQILSYNINMMNKKYKVHQKGEGTVASFDTLEETVEWIRNIERIRKGFHGPSIISPFTILTKESA